MNIFKDNYGKKIAMYLNVYWRQVQKDTKQTVHGK